MSSCAYDFMVSAHEDLDLYPPYQVHPDSPNGNADQLH